MTEQTGRDEYSCTLTVIQAASLQDNQDDQCGGIVLYSEDERIVCPNMLKNRLDLAFEEFLP